MYYMCMTKLHVFADGYIHWQCTICEDFPNYEGTESTLAACKEECDRQGPVQCAALMFGDTSCTFHNPCPLEHRDDFCRIVYIRPGYHFCLNI